MAIDGNSVWLGSPYIQKNGKDSIIITSSIGALVGGFSTAYSATKGAVHSLTKFAAHKFGRDPIRVNSVRPGSTLTGMAEEPGFKSKEEMGQAYEDKAALPP